MERVNIETFARFVTMAGDGRIGVVKRWKDTRHTPPTTADFYFELRQAILAGHRTGRLFGTMDDSLAGLTNKLKQTSYPNLARSYHEFWLSMSEGRRTWFEPPTARFVAFGDVEVDVTAEVGIEYAGRRVAAALVFGGVSGKQVDVMLEVLDRALRPEAPVNMRAGILEITPLGTTLHVHRKPPSARAALLFRAEAAAFSTIYAAV